MYYTSEDLKNNNFHISVKFGEIQMMHLYSCDPWLSGFIYIHCVSFVSHARSTSISKYKLHVFVQT